ncbi:hypothetical protein [Brevibacterium jeotgali]|nr:hypothetical protein [Brevibacterium jeotgali]
MRSTDRERPTVRKRNTHRDSDLKRIDLRAVSSPDQLGYRRW